MTSSNNNTQQEATKELEQFGYQQQLKRFLGVWQLTAFGLNYMIPIAPALIFGFILVSSGGTVALPYLLAMIAMLFTANSYSLMIQAFPFAGSLYSYVSRGWSTRIGFIAGWVLLLDYMLIPTVTAAGDATYIHAFFPLIPYHRLVIYICRTNWSRQSIWCRADGDCGALDATYRGSRDLHRFLGLGALCR